MFLDSPIIGNQFVTKKQNYYPHNFVLEVLMATGILGAIFFFGYFAVIFRQIRLAIKRINYELALLLILFFCSFLLNLTSGCMFLSNDFWVGAALISGISRFGLSKGDLIKAKF